MALLLISQNREESKMKKDEAKESFIPDIHHFGSPCRNRPGAPDIHLDG
jgi:hypothetical protein